MKAERFEDLWIWQHARELVKEVYVDFGLGTPAERDYGFRGQIQKAAVAVMNNAAEGFERRSNVEFIRFLEIAKGAVGEVRSMYYTAEDLLYVSAAIADARRKRARQIAAGIVSLSRRLRES